MESTQKWLKCQAGWLGCKDQVSGLIITVGSASTFKVENVSKKQISIIDPNCYQEKKKWDREKEDIYREKKYCFTQVEPLSTCGLYYKSLRS